MPYRPLLNVATASNVVPQETLVRIGKKLKKNNVAVDVVSFGDTAANQALLDARSSAFLRLRTLFCIILCTRCYCMACRIGYALCGPIYSLVLLVA